MAHPLPLKEKTVSLIQPQSDANGRQILATLITTEPKQEQILTEWQW